MGGMLRAVLVAALGLAGPGAAKPSFAIIRMGAGGGGVRQHRVDEDGLRSFLASALLDQGYEEQLLAADVQPRGITDAASNCTDSVAKDDDWLCFGVGGSVRLFILYDRRIAPEPPAWLTSNFLTKHSDVTAVADQTGNFDIYSNAFQAGTICAGSRRSNYTILAAPKKWKPFADEPRGHRRTEAHDDESARTHDDAETDGWRSLHSPTAPPVSAAGVACAAAALACLAVALLRLRTWAFVVLRTRVRALLSRAECPVCLERFDDRCGQRVPRMLPCGHTACEGCFALMLRPKRAEGDFKTMECPECRVVTKVLRGKASSLPKNFALLR